MDRASLDSCENLKSGVHFAEIAPMAAVPSIKGSIFSKVADDIRKLLAREELSREEASRWLKPADFELLDQHIAISSWYDVGSYARMNEMLVDVVGSGNKDYLRELGRETARQLLEAGLYVQLEYLQRTQVSTVTKDRRRFKAFGRDLRRLATLSSSILNFSRWVPKRDPDHDLRYVIEVTDATNFPEALCWRSDGFVNEMATQHGEPDLWSWSRISADAILFRMLRPL